jgi:UPF0176 protein
VVLGRIYGQRRNKCQLSLPADNFYAFKDTIEKYDFMQGMRLNIAVNMTITRFEIDRKSA